MRKAVCLIGCAIILLALVPISFAPKVALGQEVTAAITGRVTDPSGAPISGARVTAHDRERGTLWTAVTNDSGVYDFPRVPVGDYDLRIEKSGFQTTEIATFTLILNQKARIDVQMKMGQVTQTIEVTDETPLLQTQSTEVSTVIDSQTNVSLPLASRNYVQLALLAPGAVTPNREAITTANRIDNAGQPYINGNREQDNNFLLDGMDNNQVSDNLVAYSPSPDAIQEFNLITQNASSEFGNFQGGIISVSIKSGTNQFHGDAWEFFRNDVLNANNYFNNFFGVGRPPVRWNMFGGTLGGPIIKNKLFFFADYQGQRFDVNSNSTFNAFTQPERNGDFGQLCTNSGGSFSSGGICSGGGTQVLDPFTQQAVPFNNLAQYISSNADPQLTTYYNAGAGKPFQNLVNSQFYPSVFSLISTGILSNSIYSTHSPLNVDQGDIKVDYALSDKDHFFGRYSREQQVNNPVNSNPLVSVNLGTAIMSNGVVDWSHNISPTLLNDVRVGVNWVQLLNNQTANPGIGNLGQEIGIANGNSGGEGLPSITAGPSTAVGGAAIIQDWSSTVIQAGDTLDWTHGRHATRVGFQFIRERMDDFYAGNNGIEGFYTMSGTYTGAADTDFYLGLVNKEGQYFNANGSSNPEFWGQRSSIIGAFIQDDWRVTPNLTLNLGLRFQAHTPWTEAFGRQVNFDPISGQPIFPAGHPLPTTIPYPGLQPQADSNQALYNGYYGLTDWQPRLGVAWSPEFLHGKTVIRAAITTSDYLEGTGNNLRPTLNPPYSLQIQFANLIPFGDPNYNPAEFQLTAGIPPPTTSTNPFFGSILNVWAPNVRPSITQQWNLSVQQQLSRDTTFQIAYVGQAGEHLMVPVNLLQGVLQPDGTVAASPYFSGNPGLLDTTNSEGTAQSPLPGNNFRQIIAKGTYSIGRMRYDALQAVLQKRIGYGLEGQISYTYSHCLTNNIGYYGEFVGTFQSANASAYWQNTFDPRAEWGSCYFDLTHNLTAFAIYQLPVGHGRMFGKNLNPVLNAAIGGWNVSPIYSYHGGFPLTILDSTDFSTTNSFGERADCSGPPSYLKQIEPGTGLQWFNPAPYSNPVSDTFGTCGVSTVRGPGLNRWDLGIQKEFPVRESMRFEFRAEFLNAFNYPTFDAPNTTCSGTSSVVGSPSPCVAPLGLITTSEGERNIQFALKFYF